MMWLYLLCAGMNAVSVEDASCTIELPDGRIYVLHDGQWSLVE